ncbi:hypothetical protein Esi_0053_0036 [Ectocarpus siliculosus]|uniref:Uncharacterized protein n=1 Tax=Ectocarpus siliculosus TaxID=2880 RepID=D8LPQ1_ECTSI|nr:hypothetical protein Esi_0053_0036 [Ectocarpus siliculosus]|eukprot:CBN77356.1 hypothetical protein Esi_0053_0036 [Ectocarpus siliculosus]
MARKELPQALTLEKFAAGKDGRANAFKKKKQAKKRKLFEKAQLKRQYAKLLKKEAVTARGEHGPDAPRSDGAAGVGKEKRAGRLVLTPNRKWKEEASGGELKRRRELSDDRQSGERQQVAEGRKQEQRKPGKWRRPEHRPDPFKAAKALQGVTTRRSFGGSPKTDVQHSALLVGLVQHITAV